MEVSVNTYMHYKEDNFKGHFQNEMSVLGNDYFGLDIT